MVSNPTEGISVVGQPPRIMGKRTEVDASEEKINYHNS